VRLARRFNLGRVRRDGGLGYGSHGDLLRDCDRRSGSTRIGAIRRSRRYEQHWNCKEHGRNNSRYRQSRQIPFL